MVLYVLAGCQGVVVCAERLSGCCYVLVCSERLLGCCYAKVFIILKMVLFSEWFLWCCHLSVICYGWLPGHCCESG